MRLFWIRVGLAAALGVVFVSYLAHAEDAPQSLTISPPDIQQLNQRVQAEVEATVGSLLVKNVQCTNQTNVLVSQIVNLRKELAAAQAKNAPAAVEPNAGVPASKN